METLDPYKLLDQVDDRESFFVFVRALIDDYEQNPDEWQNGTIHDFLESAVAWSEATSAITHTQMLQSTASWRAFAEFLYAGKIYE